MSGNRRLTIGEVVAATPELQTDEPVNLILTPSTSTRRIVLAKLSTEGMVACGSASCTSVGLVTAI